MERGLGPDENIIVEGFHKLSHGVKVAPIIVAPERPEADSENDGRFSFGTDSTASAADSTSYKNTDSTKTETTANEK